MQYDRAGREEILDLLGRVDEQLVERVLEHRATVAELAEAIDIVEGERRLAEHRSPTTVRVGELAEILRQLLPDENTPLPTPRRA